MNTTVLVRGLAIAASSLPAAAQQLVRWIAGPGAGANYGQTCLAIGDQNGDGFADVLVGAPGFNSQRGAIYCISGKYLALGTGVQTLWSLAPSVNADDRFGAALADVGDVTGDGVADFLIGEPGYDGPNVSIDSGAVRLVNGSTHAIVSLIFDPNIVARFGSSIAVVGDLTGDGRRKSLSARPARRACPCARCVDHNSRAMPTCRRSRSSTCPTSAARAREPRSPAASI
jgi:hypothetical protein